MAALTLVAGTVPVLAIPSRADDATGARKVKLELRIAGLPSAGAGCDVEVRPAHPGCIFRSVSQHVRADGRATLILDDVQTHSADRVCAFAITIKEPGQPDQTVRRGLRISAQPNALSTLTCYLSSPSKLASVGDPRARR